MFKSVISHLFLLLNHKISWETGLDLTISTEHVSNELVLVFLTHLCLELSCILLQAGFYFTDHNLVCRLVDKSSIDFELRFRNFHMLQLFNVDFDG